MNSGGNGIGDSFISCWRLRKTIRRLCFVRIWHCLINIFLIIQINSIIILYLIQEKKIRKGNRKKELTERDKGESLLWSLGLILARSKIAKPFRFILDSNLHIHDTLKYAIFFTNGKPLSYETWAFILFINPCPQILPLFSCLFLVTTSKLNQLYSLLCLHHYH